jgi:hypothetical protein
MTAALYSQRGGCRIGRNAWLSLNATWPFAELEVHDDALVLTGLLQAYHFPKDAIRRLSVYGSGVRIEHTIAAYPRFVVFWTFKLAELRQQLQSHGFLLSTTNA